MSIESARSKAYSSDLRWRMVYQRCVLGLSYAKVAQQLNVDPTTVSRTVQLFEETGTVCSIQGYHENTCKKLSTVDEFTIMEAIVDNPSMYLHELQHLVLQTTGTVISVSAICKFLQKQKFSRKRLTYRALQRSEELRAQYMSEISLYEPQTLVFVDETGSDKRCALRRYGYALKGMRAVSDRLLIKGKRYSTIAGMSMDGMLDVHITTESVDGDMFCDYVERCLLPYLMPFNCTNPRSVVVMDNASIHHVDKVVALIEEVGAIVIYLPPYSPDIMPIEECFSKVKAYLRANDPLIQVLEGSEIEDAILSAFASVTPSDCYGWVKDCGYIHRD